MMGWAQQLCGSACMSANRQFLPHQDCLSKVYRKERDVGVLRMSFVRGLIHVSTLVRRFTLPPSPGVKRRGVWILT